MPLQELLRADSDISSPSPDMTLPLDMRPLNSKDAALVLEYAYAMRWAFAEVFSAELCKLERTGMVLHEGMVLHDQAQLCER